VNSRVRISVGLALVAILLGACASAPAATHSAGTPRVSAPPTVPTTAPAPTTTTTAAPPVDWTPVTTDVNLLASSTLAVNTDLEMSDSPLLLACTAVAVLPLPPVTPGASSAQSDAVHAVAEDQVLFFEACRSYMAAVSSGVQDPQMPPPDTEAFATAWTSLKTSIPAYYAAIGDTSDAQNFVYSNP
jgi:hypothetical protein